MRHFKKPDYRQHRDEHHRPHALDKMFPENEYSPLYQSRAEYFAMKRRCERLDTILDALSAKWGRDSRQRDKVISLLAELLEDHIIDIVSTILESRKWR